MHELAGLLLDRAHEVGMTMPHIGNGDARKKIEELVFFGIPNPRPFTLHEGKPRGIGRHNIMCMHVFDLCCCAHASRKSLMNDFCSYTLVGEQLQQ